MPTLPSSSTSSVEKTRFMMACLCSSGTSSPKAAMDRAFLVASVPLDSMPLTILTAVVRASPLTGA